MMGFHFLPIVMIEVGGWLRLFLGSFQHDNSYTSAGFLG